MNLTPDVVAAYKTLMTKPKENGLDEMPSLEECFVAAEEATSKHMLYAKYIMLVGKPIPKVIFYIIMDELYPTVKAPDGNLGWKLEIK